MAEKRNVFIKSKMNKDLDDRLIPDGEYRDAYNVTISKSEGQNVGAVEESPGNLIIPGTDSATAVLDSKQEGVNAIGEYVDEENNRVFIFYTNYCDSSTDNNDFSDPTTVPALFTSGGAAAHAIAVYNTVTKDFTTLVSGAFLNFSISSPIIGVDLVENLLFWTDNRNQPRKINVDKALEFPADSPTPYYTTEDQISVAKYYPYNPIRLWDYVNSLAAVQATMKDKFNQYYPANVGQAKADRYTNPTYDANYAGDPKYLEDKFVRFSYRFKFEDNEYSLMAPFTQEAFIPKQDGFFMSNVKPNGDEITSQEQETYESTVVPFMENKVNFIDLHIDLPDTRQNLKQNFKIKEIEILYKESDSNNIKVIDTVEIDERFETTLPTQSYHIYPYNSTKPVKTLPEKQTTRVWDRVPVKAKTQSIVGNRVVYANYVNRQPYPKNIDFLVGVSEKFTTDRNASPEPEVSRVEYPNHTLKQNRSYEVGIVLVDRYGRHSSVINAEPITQTINVGGIEYGSETVYHKYTDWQIGGATYNVLDWTGDSLKLLWQTQIATSDDKYKGLYDINNPLGWYSYKVVVKQREQDYYNVYLPGVLKGYPSFTPDDYFDGAYTTPSSNEDSDLLYHVVLINDNINKIPRNLTEVGPEQREFGSTVRLFGRVGMKLIGDPTLNIFAPGSGYKNHNIQFFPAKDGMQSDQVTQIGTMKDLNVGGNKVVVLTAGPYSNPDLYTIEYNPDVTDYMKIALPPHNITVGDTIPQLCYVYNHRENPEYDPNVAVANPPVAANCRGISTLVETVSGLPGSAPAAGPANDEVTITGGKPVLITNPVFYSSISDPLIARISGIPTDDRTPPLSPAFSSKEMGIAFDPYAGTGGTAGTQYSSRYFEPLLTVYETQAFVSNLDIFYETTSSGLISELNTAIEVSTDPAEVSEWDYSQAEDDAINTYVTSQFDIRDSANASIAMNSVTLLSVTKAGGNINITNDFEIVNFAPIPITFPNGRWAIRTKSLFYYGVDSQVSQADLYRFTLRCEPAVGSTVDLVYTGSLSNRPPVLDVSGLTLNVNSGGSLGTAIATSNGANINDVRNKNDLSFKFIQQFWLENNQQGTFFEFNESPANNYNISALSTTQPGTYTLTLGLTDCAGQGIEEQYVLTVNVLEATLTGGISAGPNELYSGTKPLWFGGSVYFVNSASNLYTGFNDKSGSVYRSFNSALPINYPATYRSIPLNETGTGFGTFTETLSMPPSGIFYRGGTARFINGTLGDAIDNNIGAFATNAQSGVKYNNALEDFNTTTAGELTNQVIVNNGGLDGGTVFFEVEIQMQDGIGESENVDRQNFFQPVRIQYRANSSAPWQEALDINGDIFKGAIWDVASGTQAYGKKAALISHAPPKVNEVRYNTDDIVDTNVTNPTNTGVYNKRHISSGFAIVTWYAFKPAWAEETGAINFNSTQQFINPMMTLRHYSDQDTSAGEGVITRTFAANAVGEYRIINGNLRCALNNNQYNTAADNPAVPAWFQGGKALPEKDRVKFNVRKGDFNAITADVWYEYRIRGNYNSVQEAGQNSLEVNPYGNLGGGIDWPNTGGGTVVYAKSPLFRYVKQFYTRSGTAGNYVYAKLNSVNNKYYAYTEPSGVPVDAGFPTGGENAFGAVNTTAPNTGCWPTWIVQLDNEGGVISTPRPLAVWDLLNDTGSSIRDDGGFFTWYCSADQAPVKYNGTC